MSPGTRAQQPQDLLERVLELTEATLQGRLDRSDPNVDAVGALQGLLRQRAALLEAWPEEHDGLHEPTVRAELAGLVRAIGAHDRVILAYLNRCRGALLEAINSAERAGGGALAPARSARQI